MNYKLIKYYEDIIIKRQVLKHSMKGLYIYKSLNKIQFVKEIKIKTVSNFLKVAITYEPNHMYQIALTKPHVFFITLCPKYVASYISL